MLKNVLVIVAAFAAVVGGALYFHSRRSQPLPVDFGVPIYPGAKSSNADSFSTRLSPRDRARLVKVVTLEADDPIEKVVSFYKEKLPGKTQVLERQKGGLPAAVFRTEIDGTAKLIMVTVNEDSKKTEISIGNITPQEPLQRP